MPSSPSNSRRLRPLHCIVSFSPFLPLRTRASLHPPCTPLLRTSALLPACSRFSFCAPRITSHSLANANVCRHRSDVALIVAANIVARFISIAAHARTPHAHTHVWDDSYIAPSFHYTGISMTHPLAISPTSSTSRSPREKSEPCAISNIPHQCTHVRGHSHRMISVRS